MEIRKSGYSDDKNIQKLHLDAFGESEGEEIANLVSDLFNDKTAQPLLSLVAVDDGEIVGHILFTSVKIKHTTKPVSAYILAPLAVSPACQKTGIGGKLIEQGLELLGKAGADLVFVLGHPEYYPRAGFRPAGAVGFIAPYPIPEKSADAWMVLELKHGIIGNIKGEVQCAETLNQPQHWQE